MHIDFTKRFAWSLCLIAIFGAKAHAQVVWGNAGPPTAADRVISVVADPRNDLVAFAASSGGGIWKTEDSGLSWLPATEAAPSLQVCALALDPRNPDVVYVGTGDDQSPRPGQGVWRSADAGRTWNYQAMFTSQPVCALGVDPANTERVFAGSAEGLFLSTDSGTTWNKVLASPVTSIAFDGSGIVYAGMVGADQPGLRENVLATSPDSGKTWTKLTLPPNPNAATAQTNWVSVIASGTNLALIVSYQLTPVATGTAIFGHTPLSIVDFYRSSSAGSTWSTSFAAGRARPPAQLVGNPVSGNLYVAGNTLLSSSNQGASWTTISTASSDFHSGAFLGTTLLLGGERGLEPFPVRSTSRLIAQLPIARSLDVSLDAALRIWTAGPAGLHGLQPAGSILPTSIPGVGAAGSVGTPQSGPPNILVAGNTLVYRSTDGGQTFSSQTVLPATEPRAPFPPLVLESANPAAAYIAGRSLYHTNDAGATWNALPVVNSDTTHVVTALAIAPASRLTLYAATACLPEVTALPCSPVSRIWRSANGGTTWTLMSTVSGMVSRLAVDPRLNNTVYAAIGAFAGGPSLTAGYIQGDLLQSANGGGVWASVRGNLPPTAINAVVIDPTSIPQFQPGGPGVPGGGGPIGPGQFNQPAQTLYVATDAGVYATFNAGVQWTEISSGLPETPITSLELRQPDGILVAGTFGRGVYRTSVLGFTPSLIVSPLSIEVSLPQDSTRTTGIAFANISTTTTIDWQFSSTSSWIRFPEPQGRLRPRTASQEAITLSTAGLSIGTHFGRIHVIAGPLTQTITIQLHVTATAADMKILSGNQATGAVGSTLPPFQVLVLDSNGAPLQGAAVNFAIISGGGSLSSRNAFSNASGIASSSLTLPLVAGPVEVLASSGGVSVTFTATAGRRFSPTLSADSIRDGVTFNSYTFYGPGSLLDILGQDLAETAVVAPSDQVLPNVIETTQALLTSAAGDYALPLLSIAPGQVRAWIPDTMAPGSYRLRVDVGSISSNFVDVSIAPYAPGIFSANGTGRGMGLFYKTDGSLVTAANPADRGTNVIFYAAGLGAVSPPVDPGAPGAGSEPFNRTVAVPRVFFDGFQAAVLYSGLAPGVAGRYQVTVRIPALVTPATNVSVSMTVGALASNRVTIPVR